MTIERLSILIVEDDKNLALINRRALQTEGYAVLTAPTLAAARELLAQQPFDVILLDVKMPDGNGFDFCREIRGNTGAHIIFLTSITEPAGELEGLRAGGNDYLRKPYGIELLRERIKKAVPQERVAARLLLRGLLTLDMTVAKAFLKEEDLKLSQKEFSMLLLFVQNEDRVLRTEDLYRTVWGQPMNDDNNAVKNAVYRLRKKIKPGGYGIAAEYGEGYRFGKGE